ncbi:IS110 family RNA-guided transposase [Amycolatopsis magusensis]|uniref:IS110 family transposase n=1 Tax=Amycolatopsis magusensis TaxID=882444 RepID=UPI0037A2E7AA
MMFYCGIDWSETLNDVAVVDSAGRIVARARVPESPHGVREILTLLSGLSTSSRHRRKNVPVAIEATHGLMVEALRKAGQPVYGLNPAVVARYRGRLNPTRKKSDKADAALLAHILRTDGHHHRTVPHRSDQAAAVRLLTRAQQASVRSRHRQHLQLRALLRQFHPAMVRAWQGYPAGLLRREALAVLARAATPAEATTLSVARWRDLLEHAGRTRRLDEEAARLHALVREPCLRQDRATEAALGLQVRAAVAALQQLSQTVTDLTEAATTALAVHPHAPLYLSFPGVGPLTGARLLGEIGDDPDRFDTARGLRAYAGAAPLTWASGTARMVTHRCVANRHLKNISFLWAFTSLRLSPGCRAYYDRRRAAGDPHAGALRRLSGRLLSCLHHCLQQQCLYDEQRAWPTGHPTAD